MEAWLLVLMGYIVGSVSTAIVVCRCLGLPDPREQGSNNPGATNVLRFGGKKAAAMTLLGDLLKGLLPVVVATLLNAEPAVIGLVGIAAFLGHLFPLFFGFQGGKGVATAAGVFFGFTWLLGAITVGTWLVMLKITRVSSLSAIIAALSAPVYGWVLLSGGELILATTTISLFCIWRHRKNIQRIFTGEEGRIGH